MRVRYEVTSGFTRGLEEIRRWRRFVWIVFSLYIPVVMIIFFVFRSAQLTMGAALGWMGLCALAGIRASLSRCPRCGKRYHYKRPVSIPWTSKCLHCGLRLKTKEDVRM